VSYQTHDQYSLLLGMMVAVGICISLSTLLFFMLSPLTSRLPGLSWLMVCIFLSAQLASKTNLLAQINLLESREIWSTQDFLSDQSIVAYLLKSLLGYEATPITAQVITYIAALALMVSVTLIRGVFRTNLNTPGEEVINVSN
jgi:high-affinity iron transporter